METVSHLRNLSDVSRKGLRLERLPTNTTTRAHPVHRWFNFIAGFSPELVDGCLNVGNSPSGRETRLLDPFSGCGTAPLAARLLGVTSFAYEPHPFFSVISEAKANSPAYWHHLPEIYGAITRGISGTSESKITMSESAAVFLGKMFREDDLLKLNCARQELAEYGLSDNPLAILMLSRILDYCCLSATDGIYKAPTSTKKALAPNVALEQVYRMLLEDALDASTGIGLATIFQKSSESMGELSDRSINLVVTSPPYLNNFDYAEMTRMYLYFWGFASSWGEITDRVRSRLIVNTTTALKGHKDRQATYRATLPANVQDETKLVVASLAERRKERAGKKEYDFLIYPYLSQMQQVIRETHRVLVRGGVMHMMVSDAALYGIHLPAPRWLAEIMISAGFEDVQCEMVRPRGHRWVLDKREGSAQGLGEYYMFGRAS